MNWMAIAISMTVGTILAIPLYSNYDRMHQECVEGRGSIIGNTAMSPQACMGVLNLWTMIMVPSFFVWPLFVFAWKKLSNWYEARQSDQARKEWDEALRYAVEKTKKRN